MNVDTYRGSEIYEFFEVGDLVYSQTAFVCTALLSSFFFPTFFAKQAAEGRKSRAATFEAEVACEAVFGSFARESFYCDDFDNFENFLPP